MPPPIEIEIQPSEECELQCVHCIGRHLSQRRGSPIKLKADLTSLIDYQVNDWKVERFRFSGLLGDPLSNSIRSFTLGFIEKVKEAGRQVIILTNGVSLKEKAVRQKLLKADCIHVSLDPIPVNEIFRLPTE